MMLTTVVTMTFMALTGTIKDFFDCRDRYYSRFIQSIHCPIVSNVHAHVTMVQYLDKSSESQAMNQLGLMV